MRHNAVPRDRSSHDLTVTTRPRRAGWRARRAVTATAALATLACLAGCGSGPKHHSFGIGPIPDHKTITQDEAPGKWHVDAKDDSLVFDGKIARGTAAGFQRLVTPKIRTVTVTSPGGDLSAALPVARYMLRHGLGLVVTGPCVGPCADYWFTAARSRVVRSGGWLGFTPDLSMVSPESSPKATSGSQVATVSHLTATTLGAAVRQERALYAAAGINAVALHNELATVLEQQNSGRPSQAPQAWMPTRADLTKLGLRGVDTLQLPDNLAYANAQAQAWDIVGVFQDTLVGTRAARPGKGR